jgi:hypothetical protein
MRLLSLMTGVLLLIAPPALAQQERLILDLWTELEPMIMEGEEHPVSPTTAAERMLEEARILLSAMIYGYRFVYTPSDVLRGVEELFELIPIAEIPWGDPRLEILFTERQGNRLQAKIAYGLVEHQRNRRSAWASNMIPLSGGTGAESVFQGQSARMDAYRDAVKQAIKEYARARFLNKPKELRGDVLLWGEPYTVISQGAYTTQVSVKLRLASHTPYRVF